MMVVVLINTGVGATIKVLLCTDVVCFVRASLVGECTEGERGWE